MITGHAIIDGVPYINGKPAIACEPDDTLVKLMGGALALWKCPECGAHLSGGDLICMNMCHLSAASLRRFNHMLGEVVYRVGLKRAAEQEHEEQ